MRVKVTLANILDYSLDVITGNSRADLLIRASEMEAEGYELFVTIPDAEGGDTDAPTERNTFQHFANDLPEPDGEVHVQQAVDLTRQYDCKECGAQGTEPCVYGCPNLDRSD